MYPDVTTCDVAGWQLLSILLDIDSLLATTDNFLLGKWIADARSWGATPDEQNGLEFNARNQVRSPLGRCIVSVSSSQSQCNYQITLWGPVGNINDYASKQWAGLIESYYFKRWRIFVDALVLAKTMGKVVAVCQI